MAKRQCWRSKDTGSSPTSDAVKKRGDDGVAVGGGVAPHVARRVLERDQLGLFRISNDGADLGQRPQRDDRVGRRVSLDETGVGEAELPPRRIVMTLSLLVHGELGHGRDVVVAPESQDSVGLRLVERAAKYVIRKCPMPDCSPNWLSIHQP